MLDPLSEPVDLIVANLPYVREQELNFVNSLPFEPGTALDGGQDGLDKIRSLCLQISNRVRPGGHLLLEIGQGQATILTDYLRGLFPSAEIELIKDLSGIDRVVCIMIP